MFVWQKKVLLGLDRVICEGLEGGAICAAANVALGTPLLISSQAVAVPMEETLALGADDWTVVGVNKCMLQQSLFLCQLNLMKIITLS